MARVLPDINGSLQPVPRTVTEDDIVTRFFDIEAYYRDGSEDDPVAQFHDIDADYRDGSDDDDSRSGSSSVHTPGLVYDTATSPSAGSDSSSAADEQEEPPVVRESHPPGNAWHVLEEIRKQDGDLIWPQPDPSQRIPGDTVPSHSTNRKTGRRSSSPVPSRQLKNPAETAQIRRLGACIKCRIEKLKCSDGGVCRSCESKFGSSLCQHTCLRKTLAETARHATQIRCTLHEISHSHTPPGPHLVSPIRAATEPYTPLPLSLRLLLKRLEPRVRSTNEQQTRVCDMQRNRAS